MELPGFLHLFLAQIFAKLHTFAKFQYLSTKPDVYVALLCRFATPPGKLMASDEVLMKLLEDDAIAG